MTDVLVTLEAALEHLPAALQARSLGAVLGKVNEKTGDAQRQAARCTALAEMVVVLGGVSDPHVRSAADNAVSQVREIGDALATAKVSGDLEIILDDYVGLQSALSKLDQSVRQLLGQKAKIEYASLIPIGELLTRIEGAQDLGRSLVELGKRAEALAAGSQPADSLGPEIVQLRKRRDSLLSDLRAFTADPDVDRFLDGVTDGGATLELLTPAVLRWLGTHRALGTFKVVS